MQTFHKLTVAKAAGLLIASALVSVALLWPTGPSGLFAQQATPHNLFRPATELDKTQLIRMPTFGGIASEPQSKVLVAPFPAKSGATLLAVRFEDKSCSEDCLTAFFMQELDEERLLGSVYLPPFASMSDTAAAICKTCPTDFPIVFKGQSGTTTIMQLGRSIMVQPVTRRAG